MRSIQIAPYAKDCKVIGHSVTGKMGKRVFVFEVPDRYRMPEDEASRQTMINNFCEAIALCSKQWQIEDLLNEHWGIKGGKFYEQK